MLSVDHGVAATAETITLCDRLALFLEVQSIGLALTVARAAIRDRRGTSGALGAAATPAATVLAQVRALLALVDDQMVIDP